MEDQRITYFAETDFRGQHKRFGIYRQDRRYHMAIIGKTGMGKSTLMANLMASDAKHGEGFALIDPHGDLAERVFQRIPENRQADVVYFDPADERYRLGLNILEHEGVEPHLVVSGVISVFKKIWAPNFWGPRMEHIFRNALWSLVHTEGTTLADVPRILLDRSYRRDILKNVPEGPVRDFWTKEFERYNPVFRDEAIAPILNKVGQFLANPLLRDVLTQPKSAFHLRAVMDQNRIFIANLGRGRLGEDESKLLGSLLMTQFELAALGRAHLPEDDRRDFYLYIDEFPTVVTPSFAGMLPEARKYRLNLILALQHVDQLEHALRDAVFENVGTLIAFRVGSESAEYLAREFQPEIEELDVVSLPRYQIYLRLMVNGVPSRVFSGRTFDARTHPMARCSCRAFRACNHHDASSSASSSSSSGRSGFVNCDCDHKS